MSAPDLNGSLAEIRDLTRRYKAGTQDSFDAVRDLFSKLLHFTIIDPQDNVRLHYVRDGTGARAVGGRGNLFDPVRLNDGNYLRVTVSLYIEDTRDGSRLKVSKAGFQYQSDFDGKRPIFRYDYIRESQRHPGSHLHIYGELLEDASLSLQASLSKIHFPTGRISIEAIIRLLADEFGVPCHEDVNFWRQVLEESERLFREIAHESAP